jgi:25S rRNA (uracil2634-N3)-methyltransferase
MSKRKGAKRRRLADERAGVRQVPISSGGQLDGMGRAELIAEATVPYRAGQRILVVGDGDFSWSRAVAALRGGDGLAATVYDVRSDIERKYGEAGTSNIEALGCAGATVLFGIDATSVNECEQLRKWRGTCAFVVFNFPHAAAGIKDEAENARLHRALIRDTLLAAAQMLDPLSPSGAGEVHITLRRGRPYAGWAVHTLADGIRGLRFSRERAFDPDLYPGYTHRRTRGLAQTRPDASGTPNEHVTKGDGSVTYCFQVDSLAPAHLA